MNPNVPTTPTAPHATPSTSPLLDDPVPIQVLPLSPPHNQAHPDIPPPAHSEGESSSEATDDTPKVDPRPLSNRTSALAQKYKLGFGVDLRWVQEIGFTELLDTLAAQSWVPLFTTLYRCEMIPSLMDEFYQNFSSGTADGEDFITSTVRNKVIKIDSAYLAESLGVPNCGYCCYFKREDGVNIDGVSKSQMMKFLRGKSKSSSINHNTLSAFHKLLFNFVWRAIVLRTQHRNEANLLDCSLIYCLAKHLPINFPKLMLKHLNYTITRGYKVGYGALFTKIFKDFDIDMSQEPIILPRDEHLLGQATMKLLKLNVVNGKAVVNAGRCEEEEDEEEEEVAHKETLQRKETKEKETRKKSVSRKRKRNITPKSTGTRTSKRRVAPKPSHRVPIEIVDDDTENVSTAAKGETNVPGSSSKAKEKGESSGPPVQQESLLQMILQQVQALETKQEAFINDTRASLATLQSNLAGLQTATSETRHAIIEKVDSIVVEEVSVDPPS